MKKKTLFILLALTIPVVMIFSKQFLIREQMRNGFARHIKLPIFKLEKTLVLPAASYIFVHDGAKALTLLNSVKPGEIILPNLSFSAHKILELNPQTETPKKLINVGRYGEALYIASEQSDSLTVNTLSTGSEERFMLPGSGYDQLNPVSRKTLVMRQVTINNGSPQRSLTKVSLGNPLRTANIDLDEQVDAYFSNDGILRHDTQGHLVYSFFYRGKFLCLDTNLKMLYQAKTIDTVTFAKMRLSRSTIKTSAGIQSRITQATPPLLINRNLILNNGFVYILSSLKADNEDWKTFNKNQVVDVYFLDNGKYSYSFYVPRHNGVKPRDLKIVGNSIFAIYENLLVAYTISFR